MRRVALRCAGARIDSHHFATLGYKCEIAADRLSIVTRYAGWCMASADEDGFSAKLALIMDALNLSRVAVARELGIDKSVVSRWLNGVNRPTEHNLTRLTEIVRKRHQDFTLRLWARYLSPILPSRSVRHGKRQGLMRSRSAAIGRTCWRYRPRRNGRPWHCPISRRSPFCPSPI